MWSNYRIIYNYTQAIWRATLDKPLSRPTLFLIATDHRESIKCTFPLFLLVSLWSDRHAPMPEVAMDVPVHGVNRAVCCYTSSHIPCKVQNMAGGQWWEPLVKRATQMDANLTTSPNKQFHSHIFKIALGSELLASISCAVGLRPNPHESATSFKKCVCLFVSFL